MCKTTLSIILLCTAALQVAQSVPAAATDKAPAPSKPISKPSEASADTVVAKGKGVEVKRGQLDEAVQSFKANAAAKGKEILPEQTAMIETALLDRLIQTQ